ncbi:MAG: hypothetical protein JST51_09725 [Armatimonadetes bacterium]|nr:hypothetical protein [Armatimonadota bacterium]
MLITLALTALAGISSAQIVRVGTYEGDSFIYSVDGSSETGYVNVQWSGYSTSTANPVGWRVVVWDTTYSQGPVASESYHASERGGNYSRTFSVTPNHPIRVELYAVGDQYSSGKNLSSTVTTSMWVQPTSTMVGTSYASPSTMPVPNMPNVTTPVASPDYSADMTLSPSYNPQWYYPYVGGAYAIYRHP